MILTIFVAICAYIVGAIPTGAWIVSYAGAGDITQQGSGNIGATNVARVMGVRYFFLVFFIDAFKAFLWMYFIDYYCQNQTLVFMSAIMLLFGNSFSVFLKGRGGKGIATAAGILIAIYTLLFYWLLGIWALALLLTRNVGISSAFALLVLPIFSLYLTPGNPQLQLLAFFICAWGLGRHAENIKTYFNIEEHSF